ncbi:head-tail joining protein [Photobacterium atrarenae]|uniref:Head-tail joining protein n=1 Tax=Photobacterium atrarenae TaxID=865757 RepID=A0ABY5GIM1_9GAMM|nr:head-tail joining protein [Photobacterium atrarenae]UTV28996.1 head-tail joining protein [Photobacterium atrarenae]
MFDNRFDQAMEKADQTIWSAFSIQVRVNGGDPVSAVYDETPIEFDSMSGALRKLSFLASSGVRVRKGDVIEFVKTGKKATVTSGPYLDGGNFVVNL